MTTYRKNSVFAGAMFLIAMVSSLPGGFMIEGVISQPNFMASLSGESRTVILGVMLELVNVFAVLGIVAALWSPFSHIELSLTAGYLVLRSVECIFAALGALIPAMLAYLARNPNAEIGAAAAVLIGSRFVIMSYFVTVFFAVGGFLLNWVLYRTRAVPVWLSLWGMAAAPAVMVNMAVESAALQATLALPIILNEIVLGIYLIVKGLRMPEA